MQILNFLSCILYSKVSEQICLYSLSALPFLRLNSLTHSSRAFHTTNPLEPLPRFNDLPNAKVSCNFSVRVLLSLAPDTSDQSLLEKLSSFNLLDSTLPSLSFNLTGYSFLTSLRSYLSFSPDLNV